MIIDTQKTMIVKHSLSDKYSFTICETMIDNSTHC